MIVKIIETTHILQAINQVAIQIISLLTRIDSNYSLLIGQKYPLWLPLVYFCNCKMQQINWPDILFAQQQHNRTMQTVSSKDVVVLLITMQLNCRACIQATTDVIRQEYNKYSSKKYSTFKVSFPHEGDFRSLYTDY